MKIGFTSKDNIWRMHHNRDRQMLFNNYAMERYFDYGYRWRCNNLYYDADKRIENIERFDCPRFENQRLHARKTNVPYLTCVSCKENKHEKHFTEFIKTYNYWALPYCNNCLIANEIASIIKAEVYRIKHKLKKIGFDVDVINNSDAVIDYERMLNLTNYSIKNIQL